MRRPTRHDCLSTTHLSIFQIDPVNQIRLMFQPLSDAFRKLLFVLDRAGYYAEHLLVLTVEAAQRAIRRLDPRLYVESWRVRNISAGQQVKDSGRVVILVLYTSGALPGFTRTFIEAVNASPFDLVIVSNGPLAPALAAELLPRCRMLIERANIGRDFGGYKDGISIVLRRFQNVSRIVIANDSVFYLADGLPRLIAALDGQDEFIGVSEVFDHHYHVASFLLSFGPDVLRSAAFRRFWTRYRPIGTRRWAIFRGEGALTASLLRAGFRPRVLFRAEDIRPILQNGTASDRAEALSLLSVQARKFATRRLQSLVDAGQIEDRRMDDSHVKKPASNDATTDAIIAAIMAHNQMHAAGFLFYNYLGLPLIKRDLLFREVQPLDAITRILNDLNPAVRDEILDDLRRRGHAKDLGVFRRILYRHSAA